MEDQNNNQNGEALQGQNEMSDSEKITTIRKIIRAGLDPLGALMAILCILETETVSRVLRNAGVLGAPEGDDKLQHV